MQNEIALLFTLDAIIMDVLFFEQNISTKEKNEKCLVIALNTKTLTDLNSLYIELMKFFLQSTKNNTSR